jgi:hypothetical protein
VNVATRLRYLRVALILVGLISVFGVVSAHDGLVAFGLALAAQSTRVQMILGVYATLGVFLLIASRNPL